MAFLAPSKVINVELYLELYVFVGWCWPRMEDRIKGSPNPSFAKPLCWPVRKWRNCWLHSFTASFIGCCPPKALGSYRDDLWPANETFSPSFVFILVCCGFCCFGFQSELLSDTCLNFCLDLIFKQTLVPVTVICRVISRLAMLLPGGLNSRPRYKHSRQYTPVEVVF